MVGFPSPLQFEYGHGELRWLKTETLPVTTIVFHGPPRNIGLKKAPPPFRYPAQRHRTCPAARAGTRILFVFNSIGTEKANSGNHTDGDERDTDGDERVDCERVGVGMCILFARTTQEFCNSMQCRFSSPPSTSLARVLVLHLVHGVQVARPDKRDMSRCTHFLSIPTACFKLSATPPADPPL